MRLRRPEQKQAPLPVTLYTRQGCGLCLQATDALRRISRRTPLLVTEVDIDGDAALQRRYFMEIPVIVVDGEEIARAPIIEPVLAEILADLAAAR